MSEKRELNWMLVWNHREEIAKKRVVISSSLGGNYPVLAVADRHEGIYEKGCNAYDTSLWKHCKPICKHEGIIYGGKCGCGEIRPLTEEMQAFIDKYGTTKKWRLSHWPLGEHGVFTGKFTVWAGIFQAVMYNEYDDFSVDITKLNGLREYKEPKTVPLEFEDYLRMNITHVLSKNGKMRRAIADIADDHCILGTATTLFALSHIAEHYTQTNGKPLTKEDR